jgi:ABC-2 type transport system ATP-binding protein
MAAADPAVVADGLTRIFDDATAVANVSFEVPAGSIFGIIGPSGSGKTTTLRMIMGSIAPTNGSVRVLGDEPLRFRRQTRERIGYMPQHFILYPDLSVSENVDFVGSLFGLFTWRRRGRVQHVLKLLDLWDVRKRRAKDLSGGMQRRLELACALVHEPRLLILDEPTAGLDPLLRLTVWKELHRLRDSGVTIVVTTQYVTETEECDEVALISEGSLIALADPNGLRRAAFGGDVVEITTKATFDAAVLARGPHVHEIRQTGLREIRATVDDAGEGLPVLVDAISAAGGEVEAAREARPTFDEVFAELVERHRRELAQGPAVPRGVEPTNEPEEVSRGAA